MHPTPLRTSLRETAGQPLLTQLLTEASAKWQLRLSWGAPIRLLKLLNKAEYAGERRNSNGYLRTPRI